MGASGHSVTLQRTIDASQTQEIWHELLGGISWPSAYVTPSRRQLPSPGMGLGGIGVVAPPWVEGSVSASEAAVSGIVLWVDDGGVTDSGALVSVSGAFVSIGSPPSTSTGPESDDRGVVGVGSWLSTGAEVVAGGESEEPSGWPLLVGVSVPESAGATEDSLPSVEAGLLGPSSGSEVAEGSVDSAGSSGSALGDASDDPSVLDGGSGDPSALEGASDDPSVLDGGSDDPSALEGASDDPSVLDGGSDDPSTPKGASDDPSVLDGGSDDPSGLDGGSEDPSVLDGGSEDPSTLEGASDDPSVLDGGSDDPSGLEGASDDPSVLDGGSDDPSGLDGSCDTWPG